MPDLKSSEDAVMSGASFEIIPHLNSKKLVIFFSGTDRRDGRFDWWTSGHKVDAHVIFFNNGANEWYQRGVPGFGKGISGTLRQIRWWKKHLGVTEIYTVGVSMGGYGAALYGVRLNARVLAFGYDPLLRLPGSRSEKRLPARIPVRVPDLAPEIARSTGTVFHYVGECDTMDLVGGLHLQHTPNVKVVTLKGVGHGGAPFVERQFGLVAFLNLFINNNELPTFEQEGKALATPELVHALHAGLLAERKGDEKTALLKAQEALRLAPQSEAALMAEALIHFKQRDFVRALPLFQQIATQAPHYEKAIFKLAQTLRSLGDSAAALPVFERYIEMVPKSSSGYFNKALCLLRLRQRADALNAIEIETELDPDSAPIGDLRRRIEVSLQRQIRRENSFWYKAFKQARDFGSRVSGRLVKQNMPAL